MTKNEAILVTGFTGVLCCALKDFQADVSRRAGRPVYVHEIGSSWVSDLYREDFMQMLERTTDASTAPLHERALAERDETLAALTLRAEQAERAVELAEGEIAELRAQLDEYERAPTVAKTHGEYGDRIMYLYPFSDKYPPVGTELIARPARKGE